MRMRQALTTVLMTAAFATGVTLVAQAPDHDHGAMGSMTVEHSSNSTAIGKKVEFASGSEVVTGELFLPPHASSKATQPAVLLIHEWWGLNDWVRQQAQEYASAGYITLAVDLYRGQVATTPDEAHELSRGLPQDRAMRDLIGAEQYLRSREDVGSDGHVGVVGWCMGGGLAIQFAVNDPRLTAVVVNYGALPTDPDAIKKIQAPVLGNFGGLDKGIPPSSVTAFEQAMRSAGKQIDVKEYPDAGHAFENVNNKAGYNAADAVDARSRTFSFLSRTLR